jgi:hypothetical protein
LAISINRHGLQFRDLPSASDQPKLDLTEVDEPHQSHELNPEQILIEIILIKLLPPQSEGVVRNRTRMLRKPISFAVSWQAGTTVTSTINANADKLEPRAHAGAIEIKTRTASKRYPRRDADGHALVHRARRKIHKLSLTCESGVSPRLFAPSRAPSTSNASSG